MVFPEESTTKLPQSHTIPTSRYVERFADCVYQLAPRAILGGRHTGTSTKKNSQTCSTQEHIPISVGISVETLPRVSLAASPEQWCHQLSSSFLPPLVLLLRRHWRHPTLSATLVATEKMSSPLNYWRRQRLWSCGGCPRPEQADSGCQC